MSSLYLRRLSPQERKSLVQRLYESQGRKCFICQKEIDLNIHANTLDIDHVEPTRVGGKDDPSNFALTHLSCNRSKQAADLRVARILARFSEIAEQIHVENRSPNLSDILGHYNGAKHHLPLSLQDGQVAFSFPELGNNDIYKASVYKDDLSGAEYFFAKLPIEYLFHDDRINPRGIGNSLRKLIEEFHKKNPQLHIGLAWIDTTNGDKVKVKVFDGQHKAAAQVLLGVRELPVRVFVNPDLDVLLETNTNAGTKLRQIAFDKSVQRSLGSALFQERIEKYRHDMNLEEDNESFSEKDIVDHFRGEWRVIKKYVLDAVRNSISHHPDNKLKDYIEFGGKAKEKPFSYSTIEKTFYAHFINGDILETSLDYRLEEGLNPRELEKEQILRLMNIIADKIYIGKYDPTFGSARIENKIQKNEEVDESHVRAHRMAREEILYNWLKYIRQIVHNFYIMQGVPVDEKKLFQYRFPDTLWTNLENFIDNISKLPVWVNRELSATVYGGKQNLDFWQHIFETGQTPSGQQVLSEFINLMNMIQEQ